jgi:hypothetical protein
LKPNENAADLGLALAPALALALSDGADPPTSPLDDPICGAAGGGALAFSSASSIRSDLAPNALNGGMIPVVPPPGPS